MQFWITEKKKFGREGGRGGNANFKAKNYRRILAALIPWKNYELDCKLNKYYY